MDTGTAGVYGGGVFKQGSKQICFKQSPIATFWHAFVGPFFHIRQAEAQEQNALSLHLLAVEVPPPLDPRGQKGPGKFQI